MPRLKSGMTWFEDEEWIGSTISFDQHRPSTWRLVQKIRERENWYDEDAWKNRDMPSEARGIFVCEEEGQQISRQAVVKIYMQYESLLTIPLTFTSLPLFQDFPDIAQNSLLWYDIKASKHQIKASAPKDRLQGRARDRSSTSSHRS